jgi:hypothetical protein
VDTTAPGTILGTMQYMAPEQLEGKEADARTDIFAFGLVLYEIVAGKKAFEGRSQALLIAAIMSADPVPLSKTQPTTPAALDYVVKRCLAKDPERRLQTACDLVGQLQWIAEGGTDALGLPAPIAALRRRRGTLARLALAIVALLAGIMVVPALLAVGGEPSPIAAPTVSASAPQKDGRQEPYFLPDGRQ